MVNFIFRTQQSFSTYPNELIPINGEYAYKEESCVFGSLSKTNIFIGENNSGKSRFLRGLFKNDFLAADDENINEFCAKMRIGIDCPNFDDKTSFEKFNIIYEIVKRDKKMHYYKYENFFRSLAGCSRTLNAKNKYYFPTIRGVKDYKSILDTKLRNFLESAASIKNKDSIYHFISLLNLEKNGLESFDIYREIIMHEYFPNRPPNIITGGDLYGKIKSMLLGKEADRKLIADFQLFLRNCFFADCETVQLIPNESEKVLYVKIGCDERPIYDWGDGTQQLIIILFTLFIHKDEEENFFFIEEPEIYLHPGILRKFIEVINSNIFPNHQYFITTHSNNLLDISADSNIEMSIFKFVKRKTEDKSSPQFLIEQCNNGDVSLLNVLGVRNSSVFLSNCSIWVEGITDRLYLKHYLDLYFKKQRIGTPYRENIDYTFIEYGGGNIVHFNFDQQDSNDSINAKYINNRIFLIADNDNTRKGTKKHERKEHLKELLQDRFYELPVTEIENLLDQTIIEKILLKQNPKHASLITQKSIQKSKYKNRKLGSYLDKLFNDTGVKKYSSESGAIRDKLAFCRTATEMLTDYDMLSDEAKDLVEKIVAFIQSNS